MSYQRVCDACGRRLEDDDDITVCEKCDCDFCLDCIEHQLYVCKFCAASLEEE